MRGLRLTLFLLGIILTILGWFFDRASEFKWLLRTVAADYAKGIDVLDGLASDSRLAVNSKHPGFTVLLDRWPELTDKTAVAVIARTVAFMEFGPQVRNDFELIARDKNGNEVGKRWRDSAARKVITDERDKRLFFIGAVIFFAGLIITASTGLLEFVAK